MEKYLRLLNPKTTNYESTGGGNYGALTTQDVCIAISFAKLSTIQSHLVNLYALSQNSIDQIKLSTKVIHIELNQSNESNLNKDHEISLFIALVEMCKVPADYKSSVRNRAVIGGVSKDRVQRNLNRIINHYKDMLNDEIKRAFSKIEYQIDKNNS